MDASLVHQSHGGGLSWLNQGNNWVQTLPLCQGRGQEPLQTGWNFYLKYVLNGLAPSDAVDGYMDASLVHQSQWINK